jgi:ribokinase
MVGKDQHLGAGNSIFILGSFVVACCVKVQRLPSAGESLRADAFSLEAGGKGFNIAAGARRLGADVDGLLAVGDDFFASLAEAALAKMDLRHRMLVRQSAATGAGVGFIDKEGENCIAVFPGANALLSANHVADAGERLTRARLVIAQYEIGDEPIKAAFAAARRAGCLTILNPSPYRAIHREILSSSDIIIVNRIEASRLGRDLGMPDHHEDGDAGAFQALAEALLGAGASAVIVTLGGKGAIAWRNGLKPILQPAFAVEVVDTIGAGDAFTAGFATCMAESGSFEEGLRWGAAAGACVTASLGVLDALPTRPALEALLNRH